MDGGVDGEHRYPSPPQTGAGEHRHATLAATRPQLHAALYGRTLTTLRSWLGDPTLMVELTMTKSRDSAHTIGADLGDTEQITLTALDE
jgi:hypothetical protein